MPSKLCTIYNNLADLLDAGVPIIRSVKTVVGGFKGKYRAVLDQMLFDISHGQSIAESMAKHTNIFSQMDIMTIQAGETAGTIEKTFKQLAHWQEFQYRMKRKLISGMLLPILLVHFAAVLGPFPVYILGRISGGQYIVSALSILASFYVPICVIIFIYKFTPQRGPLRKLLDGIILKIPVLGLAVKTLNIARFTRAFSMLCEAAVPPVRAAEQAVLATKNCFVASWFAPMAESARQGNPLSEGLLPAKAKLGDYYYHSWLIGEETGDLDRVTDRLAKVYTDNAEELFLHFYAWLPRFVYVYVAINIIIQILRGYAAIYSNIGVGLQP